MSHFVEIATPKIRKVQLVDRLGSEPNIVGTIHLTTSHFVFRADDGGKEIWVANALISSAERLVGGQSSASGGSRLVVKCKHFQVLLLLIPKEADCQALIDTLIRCSRPMNINGCFAFVHRGDSGEARRGVVKAPAPAEIWGRLEWRREFERQQVSTEAWAESSFNSDYKYCDTYPENLWLPAKATTQLMIGSSKFRSRGRLPALTYYYKANGAVICRCAQPLAGFSARCVEDENLMELVMKANPSATPLYIVDTRPRVNAMVNKVQGKGFEDVRNYTNIQFHFFDIENIHVMRSSLNKLLEACHQRPITTTDYLKIVDSSGWLKHLRSLLDCGKFIAESILRGNSCVVHCSDGWDRTAQTVSLAQYVPCQTAMGLLKRLMNAYFRLILDPFYRTIKGFQVLLEKDWLGFGFKFDDRCAHTSTSGTINGTTVGGDENSKEASPIFTQFLDVVHQIAVRKPTALEFNERFLLEVNEHAYSCLYGTFLGNCDKDRRDLRLAQRTQSLWNYMDKRLADYLNPFYKKDLGYLMDIDLRPSSFSVWTHMYNRFDTGIQCREYLDDVAVSAKFHVQILEAQLREPRPSIPHPRSTVRWQSLLLADECSSPNCRGEFLSRFEKRLHCVICGQIYCHSSNEASLSAAGNSTTPNNGFERKMCKGCANSAVNNIPVLS